MLLFMLGGGRVVAKRRRSSSPHIREEGAGEGKVAQEEEYEVRGEANTDLPGCRIS